MKSVEISQVAAILGRLGGLKQSPSKARSSRANGKKGGRPPKLGIRDWTPFMDALDSCRRRVDLEPFQELYVKSRFERERALISATARHLCRVEFKCRPPRWAERATWLKSPWFVAEVENLKAMAIVQSPPDFKLSNIFVLDNFLSRA